jgi:uncharacterized protein involved in response to NO
VTTNNSTTRGPIVLQEGFRFFFLAAAIFSALSMLIWIGWLAIHAAGAALTDVPFSPPPHQWHAHEMLFGYGAAVVAGFLLTAVPSWTGAPPSRITFISAIAALWVAGRLAVFFSSTVPAPLVMVIDIAFIPALSVKILLNLLKRPKPQNMMFIGLLSILFVGNVLVHLDWTGVLQNTAANGLLVGLLGLSALIAVLGGRVTPAFTRNALLRLGQETDLPVTHAWREALGIGSAILLVLLIPFNPDPRLLAAIAGVAAVSNGMRLSGWRTWAVLDQPILWSLHLGFAMLVAGYAALALHWADLGLSKGAAVHVLGVGAIGGMTLAVMSRAILGHTGRPLVVPKPIAIGYAVMALAAVVRSFGVVILPDSYFSVMFVAGALWVAVFGIFICVYAPMLTSPRLQADPEVPPKHGPGGAETPVGTAPKPIAR